MDRPLSYWIAVARKSFDNDFRRNFESLGLSRADLAKRLGATPAYVSKVLNGASGNYQLSTMTKLARAIGAIVQIRLIKEEGEAVRVVDYETAAAIDDKQAGVLAPTAAATQVEQVTSVSRAEQIASVSPVRSIENSEETIAYGRPTRGASVTASIRH